MVSRVPNRAQRNLPTPGSCKSGYLEHLRACFVRQQYRQLKTEHMDQHIQAAIDEARLGRSQGGIPIGSVLVREGKIIARGHNKRVQEKNPILHGEMDCLNNAGRIGSYKGTTIYSTLCHAHVCRNHCTFRSRRLW